jgi:hypothetical protein
MLAFCSKDDGAKVFAKMMACKIQGLQFFHDQRPGCELISSADIPSSENRNGAQPQET